MNKPHRIRQYKSDEKDFCRLPQIEASELPEKPDLYTGLPRPPHAPLEDRWRPGDAERTPKKIPEPPPGQGSVLEYFQLSKKGAISPGIFAMGLLILYGSAKLHGFGWLIKFRDWPLWLIVISMFPLYYFSLRANRISAGAEWFQYGKKWVRTYELARISLEPSGPKLMFELVDRSGRNVRIPLVLHAA